MPEPITTEFSLTPIDAEKLKDLNNFTLEVVPAWVYLPQHMPTTLHWRENMSPIRYNEIETLMRLIETNLPEDEYKIYLNCLLRIKSGFGNFESRIPQKDLAPCRVMLAYREMTSMERLRAFYEMKKNWVHLQ